MSAQTTALPDGVTTPPGRARAGIALAVILTAQLMLVLDATIVNVALPVIRGQFGFSPATLSWVLNAYTLAFGGLLLLGGRLGDVLGYRRTFMVGLSIFVISSALGGAAQSAEWLITARAVQGIGAALAAPAALSLLTRSHPEGPARNRALGLFAAVSSGGASIGLILGGVLTSGASWRWSLLINVPIGIAAIVIGSRLLPDTERRREPFDIPGALTAVIGMTSLVAGFVWIPEYGWSLRTVVSLAVGVAAMASFAIIERRAGFPLFALRLLREPNRVTALLAFMLVVGGQMGGFFFLVQYLQVARGYDAFTSGLAFLPLTVGIFAVSRIAPRLITRYGPFAVGIGGMIILLAAHLMLSRITLDGNLIVGVLLPMMMLGIGAGATFLPMNIRILSGVPAQDAGSASGMLQTAQQAGGAALGLAVLIAASGIGSTGAGATPVPALITGMHHAFGTAVIFVSVAVAVTVGALIRERVVARRAAAQVVEM
ncbi:MFS transporter [Microlunatus soli]|uniref:Drug resistance transporter, EmrB/QacA subfamily n=1 Tax=Microlunatus soli TaxID=630515 RepID=A0A1H1RRF3_9ACTN|nr:MFS transporter [Microlunatus soli]SDS37599.1 drug resistance transporter, EmrB/QacA subfamily [Microlunatus soli]